MSTKNADLPDTSGSSSPVASAPPPAGSSARLVVLLALLATVIGAYAYDYFVARPECDATFNKIQEFVDARNKLGVKDGVLVTPDELHKEIGMQPTSVEKHNDKQYEVEYYCWWADSVAQQAAAFHLGRVCRAGSQVVLQLASSERSASRGALAGELRREGQERE